MRFALPNYDHELRRQCAAGTARYKAALAQAGYCKPDKPDTSRPERTINHPWPGPDIERTPCMTLPGIARYAARRYGVKLNDLRSAVRTHRVTAARQEAYYLAQQTGRYSLHRIGQYFNKDHSTVHYGIAAYRKRRGLS